MELTGLIDRIGLMDPIGLMELTGSMGSDRLDGPDGSERVIFGLVRSGLAGLLMRSSCVRRTKLCHGDLVKFEE